MLFQKNPQTIYWDVDDTIINSAESAIKIINEKYNIPNGLKEKSIKDLKDWNMKSIYRNLTSEELEEIFSLNEFWANIKLKPLFINILNNKRILKDYKHVFISHGSDRNLLQKEIFLRTELRPYFGKDFYFIGLKCDVPKSSIDMEGGIQIDDNINNLTHTNAKLKILIKNLIETDYNDSFAAPEFMMDNLYEVNTLDEVEQILDFNAKVKKKDKL